MSGGNLKNASCNGKLRQDADTASTSSWESYDSEPSDHLPYQGLVYLSDSDSEGESIDEEPVPSSALQLIYVPRDTDTGERYWELQDMTSGAILPSQGPAQENYFHRIPDEIIAHIFSLAIVTERLYWASLETIPSPARLYPLIEAMALVCKRFQAICGAFLEPSWRFTIANFHPKPYGSSYRSKEDLSTQFTAFVTQVKRYDGTDLHIALGLWDYIGESELTFQMFVRALLILERYSCRLAVLLVEMPSLAADAEHHVFQIVGRLGRCCPRLRSLSLAFGGNLGQSELTLSLSHSEELYLPSAKIEDRSFIPLFSYRDGRDIAQRNTMLWSSTSIYSLVLDYHYQASFHEFEGILLHCKGLKRLQIYLVNLPDLLDIASQLERRSTLEYLNMELGHENWPMIFRSFQFPCLQRAQIIFYSQTKDSSPPIEEVNKLLVECGMPGSLELTTTPISS